MCNDILISVVIPQRNAVKTLPRLFASIPERKEIEIIIVDNSPIAITKEDIGVDREYKLLWSAPERHAGGARNVGIDNASGKWLLFADADDFFDVGAFDLFFSKTESDVDIIYTCMGGMYDDTGEMSNRGDVYTSLVKDYLAGLIDEMTLKMSFTSPCCKLVRRELVVRYSLRYDEIIAGNDRYFSITSGYYARKIEAIEKITYIATVSRGTLTRRKDKTIVKSRLYAKLHCNEFLKRHGLSGHQSSIMSNIYDAKSFGVVTLFEFISMVLKFRQNPFVGWRRWSKSYHKAKTFDKSEKKYIVR